MPGKSKRWQTQIEIRTGNDESSETVFVYVYGETIDKLREAVKTYLLTEKPVHFGNVGDHFVGCFWYDSDDDDTGWYRTETQLINGNMDIESLSRENCASFEAAVTNFIAFAFIPEKGPDYRSKAIVGSDLRLPLLEKVLREAEEHPINDLIQRGWHLIALEYKGELSITGELANRKAIFVVGHPEAQAAWLTIESKYYKKRFFATER